MLFFNISEADSFRFSQTTLEVKQFMTSGFDPRTPLPIFGNHSYIPFEFPLFQGIAASLGKILGLSPIVATRLTALLFFQISCFLLFKISKIYFSPHVAKIAVILFEFTPFGLRFAHSPLIEFAPIALMLFSLYIFTRIEEINLLFLKISGYFLALLAFDFSYLSKVTTGIALTPLILLPVFRKEGNAIKSIRRLNQFLFVAACLVTGSVLTYRWNLYADKAKSLNPLSAYLISTTPQMKAWNIGSVHDRFSLKSIETIFMQYMGPISGGILVVLFLFIFALRKNEVRVFILVLIFTIFFPIILFFNLYKNHEYYVSAIYPVIILLNAVGIVALAEFLNPLRVKRIVSVFLILYFIFSTDTRYGINYWSDILSHSKPPSLAAALAKNVPQGEMIMYLGCDWNPEIPYYVDRPTLMVPDWNIKPLDSDLSLVRYVFFCNIVKEQQDQKIKKYFKDKTRVERLNADLFKVG